jgi:hypothetical protein
MEVKAVVSGMGISGCKEGRKMALSRRQSINDLI